MPLQEAFPLVGVGVEFAAILICSINAPVFTSSDKIFSKSLGSITSFTFHTPSPRCGSTSTDVGDPVLTAPSSFVASVTALREQFPIALFLLDLGVCVCMDFGGIYEKIIGNIFKGSRIVIEKMASFPNCLVIFSLKK